MYHLPVYESSRHATAKHIYLFLFSLRFPYQSYGEKKNEICSLPHLISFPQNAASYLTIMFLATARLCFPHFIFMLVFNVKLRKETNYNIIALWDEQHSSFTLDAYMTPDFYDRAEDLYLMAYLTLVCWRSYTILNYKVCFKIDIVDSSLFFVIELFFRGAVV